MKKNTTWLLIGLVVVVVGLFLIVSRIGGSEGAGANKAAKTCVSVKVDTIKPGKTLVDVLGTVTNNCSRNVSYAKIETTCFSTSGNVLDRDPEVAENIASGAKAYYDAILKVDPKQVDQCSSEVTAAGY